MRCERDVKTAETMGEIIDTLITEFHRQPDAREAHTRARLKRLDEAFDTDATKLMLWDAIAWAESVRLRLVLRADLEEAQNRPQRMRRSSSHRA